MFLNGEIWMIKLYPIEGSEQDGIRPCLIVGPDSMNQALNTVIVIPLTSSKKNWPTRVDIFFLGKNGQVCIEHIRSISKSRFLKKLGQATTEEMAMISDVLQATFAR